MTNGVSETWSSHLAKGIKATKSTMMKASRPFSFNSPHPIGNNWGKGEKKEHVKFLFWKNPLK